MIAAIMLFPILLVALPLFTAVVAACLDDHRLTFNSPGQPGNTKEEFKRAIPIGKCLPCQLHVRTETNSAGKAMDVLEPLSMVTLPQMLLQLTRTLYGMVLSRTACLALHWPH